MYSHVIMDKALAARIKAARISAGLSARRMAGRMDKAPATVGSWEKAKTSPTWEDLRAVARVCGVPLGRLTNVREK